MIKYCLYLPEPMIASLKAVSKEKEMPVSEIVRRYVDKGLDNLSGNSPVLCLNCKETYPFNTVHVCEK